MSSNAADLVESDICLYMSVKLIDTTDILVLFQHTFVDCCASE